MGCDTEGSSVQFLFEKRTGPNFPTSGPILGLTLLWNFMLAVETEEYKHPHWKM